jgi:acyl-CoA hydrolase
VVTASIDRMEFKAAVKVGELMLLHASVNRVGKQSMEIGVRVVVEDLMTGEQRHAASAYLTFVAMGPDKKPAPVPDLILETPTHRRRNREAMMRRELRLEERKRERLAQESQET